MAAQLLVVEDDAALCSVVDRYLQREGHRVVTAATGADALRALGSYLIDLVVLDLGLPDVPGEEVLRASVEAGVPVIIASARAGLDDRIHGLELGADDYLTKPYSPRELVLRVAVTLRRTRGAPGRTVASYGSGCLTIDEERHEVRVEGAPVHLTPHEWVFLTTLAGRPGRVFSRNELVYRMHGIEFDGYDRSVDTHMKNLRRKLGDTTEQPRFVETVLGAGYRLLLGSDPGPG